MFICFIIYFLYFEVDSSPYVLLPLPADDVPLNQSAVLTEKSCWSSLCGGKKTYTRHWLKRWILDCDSFKALTAAVEPLAIRTSLETGLPKPAEHCCRSCAVPFEPAVAPVFGAYRLTSAGTNLQISVVWRRCGKWSLFRPGDIWWF